MNFRLSSLLITTTGICCLFGMFTVLGPDALFFLVPIACTCLGYLIGWRSRYPVTGAVFGTSVFVGYVATMPLVTGLGNSLFTPSKTLAYVMNSYWMPYGAWADCFNAWDAIVVWEDFASQVPLVATFIVFATIAGANFSAFLVERRTRQAASAS